MDRLLSLFLFAATNEHDEMNSKGTPSHKVREDA